MTGSDRTGHSTDRVMTDNGTDYYKIYNALARDGALDICTLAVGPLALAGLHEARSTLPLPWRVSSPLG